MEQNHNSGYTQSVTNFVNIEILCFSFNSLFARTQLESKHFLHLIEILIHESLDAVLQLKQFNIVRWVTASQERK